MATGYSSPLRKDKGGRLKLTSGGLHLAELLMSALGDGTSDNPFQEPGLGEFMIFQIPQEQIFSQVADRIRIIFESFEDDELAKLQDSPANLQGKEGTEPGTWEMQVLYIDLETDIPGTLKVVGGQSGFDIEVI